LDAIAGFPRTVFSGATVAQLRCKFNLTVLTVCWLRLQENNFEVWVAYIIRLEDEQAQGWYISQA
jgi:hypothetical protein